MHRSLTLFFLSSTAMPGALKWILAPFADPYIGAVGTSQEMRTQRKGQMVSWWEVMADMRLSLRFTEAMSMQVLDGGISCLSGRTAAYRKMIFTPEFEHKFLNEFYRGKYHLHSGDDKFLTR